MEPAPVHSLHAQDRDQTLRTGTCICPRWEQTLSGCISLSCLRPSVPFQPGWRVFVPPPIDPFSRPGEASQPYKSAYPTPPSDKCQIMGDHLKMQVTQGQGDSTRNIMRQTK